MNVATPPDALVSAIREVLKPLVRVLVANGLTYTYLTRLMKGLYVEVAEENFGVAGRKLTDSRISLLTGVHRKDVKQLRGQVGERFSPPPSVNIGSRVVDRWITDPRFNDADGRARPLHRSERDAEGVCFETLVDSVSKDVHPRTVLDELERLGVVRIEQGSMVYLNIEAFVPREGFEELLYFFGTNLHDHIAAASHNLMGQDPGFLELAAYHEGLTAESLNRVRQEANERARDALVAIDRLAQELGDGEETEAAQKQRMRFGVYFYTEADGGDPNAA